VDLLRPCWRERVGRDQQPAAERHLQWLRCSCRRAT